MIWFKQLFTRSRRYNELSESIREHLEEKIADLVDRGMTHKEAERTARREFGNAARIEERGREVWQWTTLESTLADLRFALRQFLKAPAFAVTAILVLALGVAASVSIFTFVNAALLKPLPYQDPSRIVGVFENNTSCPECSLSYLDYQDWRSGNTAFRSFEIWEARAYLWRSAAGVEALRAGRVSGGFFQTHGVSVATAIANMSAIAAQLQKQYPQSNLGQGALVMPLSDFITVGIRPMLFTLLAGSALLLLIACVNIASLLLVRSENRRREMAVRGALGASLARLTRQLVIEAALLVTLSMSCGVAVAWGTVHLLVALIPERVFRGMPYFRAIGFDHRVLFFVAAMSILALAVCTAAPMSRLSITHLRAGLATGTRSSSRVWRKFGSNLVVVELALAIVLLAAAGLLGKSFYRILRVDLNFNPAHLATLEIDANTGYNTTAQQLALSHRLIGTISAVPGVQSVGTVSSHIPVTCNCDATPYRVLGQAWNGAQQQAVSSTVSAAYFTTLQARLLSGRLFTETDNASHPPVVLINRTMAQQFFAGEDPIGRIIGDQTLSRDSLHQVVGVVDDVREGELNEPIRPAVYFSADQHPGNYFFLVVRTAQDPAVALPAIVAAVHNLDIGVGVRNEFTMGEHIHDGSAFYLHSSAAWLVGGFAACALVLGVIGLYGVVAYSVSQRTCEIGIRMALGAQRSSIGRLVLGEAASLVLLGLVLGVVCSLLTGRLLRSLLFGVRSWDVAILATVCAVLAFAALIAAVIPARSAASVDPMQALRNE
jgi:predicted permease